MKRHQRNLFEQVLAELKKTNFLLEQLIRLQAISNQRILQKFSAWHKDDLTHHSEENNLIKKVFAKKDFGLVCSKENLLY